MITTLSIGLVILSIAVIVLIVMLNKQNSQQELQALLKSIELLESNQEKIERSVKDEISRNREETTKTAKEGREELTSSLNSFSDSLFSHISTQLKDISTLQRDQLGSFGKNLTGFNENFSNQISLSTKHHTERLDKMRETVEQRLKLLQDDNNVKLEKMRETVDEKLHSTLEKRLGESFKLVSDRLELVHKGLGEMQNLATGVGDLKNILSNVKTRGTWGEIQLGSILEQTLSPEQFSKNVAVKKGTSERVDFAINLPGRSDNDIPVFLPIDAKFPQEDYQRLIEAQENANAELAEEASKQLENRIKLEAKSIRDKYIDPPNTTDFAILFLPVEGLFAEVLRRNGLCEKLQREMRVVIAGPTTFTALLNSLQMGFRTLAIEKRSSEVWTLLGAVKTEFSKFGDILEKTHKKLQEAGNTIETAARKSRTIERKLKTVQELPTSETNNVLVDSIDNN